MERKNRYLTFRWMDVASTVAFDGKGKTMRQIHGFIEDAFENGESVLVHSMDGNSRGCCVVLAYLVYNFRWSLGQALAFVESRRPEVNPRIFFLRQLKICMKTQGLNDDEALVSVTDDLWQKLPENASDNELVVRNTFLNNNQLIVEADRGLVKVPIQVDCEEYIFHLIFSLFSRCSCSCCLDMIKKAKKINWSDDIAAVTAGFVFERPPGASYSHRVNQPATPHPHAVPSAKLHKDLNLAKTKPSICRSPRGPEAFNPLIISPRPNDPTHPFVPHSPKHATVKLFAETIDILNDDDPTPRENDANDSSSLSSSTSSSQKKFKSLSSYISNSGNEKNSGVVSSTTDSKMHSHSLISAFQRHIATDNVFTSPDSIHLAKLNLNASAPSENISHFVRRNSDSNLNIKADSISSATLVRSSLDSFSKAKSINSLSSNANESVVFSEELNAKSANKILSPTFSRPVSSSLRKLPPAFSSPAPPVAINTSMAISSLQPKQKPPVNMIRPVTAIVTPTAGSFRNVNSPAVRGVAVAAPYVSNALMSNSLGPNPTFTSPIATSVRPASSKVTSPLITTPKMKSSISSRPKTPAMLAGSWKQQYSNSN